MKHFKLIIFGLIGVLTLAVILQFVNKNSTRSRAGGGVPVTVSFLNKNQLIGPNSAFTLDVIMSTTNRVSAATVTLQYDPSVLDFVSSPEGQATSECTAAGFKFTKDLIVITNSGPSNVVGFVTITRAAVLPDAQLPSGSFCFGGVSFRPKAGAAVPSSTVVSVYDPTSWSFAGPDGGMFGQTAGNNPEDATINITNAPITPSVSPNDVQLNLKLKLQGVGAGRSGTTTMLARVGVMGQGMSTPVTNTGIFTYAADGTWTGIVPFPGVASASGYLVYVKGEKHVQKKVCETTPTESYKTAYRCDNGTIGLQTGVNTFDFSGIEMPVGDLPLQDKVINAYDITLVRNNLGKSDPEAVRLADVNYDGVVTTQDYSLIIEALETRPDD